MDLPFIKEAITGLFSRSSCDMYPVKPSPAAARYRGRIAFDPTKCINCGMCERVCAGGAISSKIIEKTPEGDRITRTFNLGSCTFCGHCADFCTRKAITLTDDYHMIATKEEDLLVSGTYLKAAPKKPAPKPAAVKPVDEQKPAAAAEPAAKADTEAKPEEKAEAQTKPTEVSKTEPATEVQPRDDGKPVSDPSKCVYCTLCAKKCPMGAIEVVRAEKKWALDEEKCIACGTCADACPKKCIIM